MIEILPVGGSVRKTLLILSFALLWLFVVTACTPRGVPEALATSTCEPPCWQGIVPGETTHTQVITMLPTLPFVKVDTIQYTQKLAAAHLNAYAGVSGLRVHFDEDQSVKVITLHIRSKFTFAEVIEYYGVPEKVLALEQRRATVYLSYFLIYPENGLVVLSNTGPIRPEKARSAIRPDDVVDFVRFR
jgi:hypothetical protein